MAKWRKKLSKVRRKVAFRWKRLSEHPLTKDHPVRAAARHARMLVLTRVAPERTTFPFANDLRFSGRRSAGIMGNASLGLDDFGEMGFLLHLLRPDDLFLDVGANVGSYSLLAAGGAKARVIAVEPVATTRVRMAENLALNGLEPRVSVRPVAIGERPGRVSFTTGNDAMNRVAPEGSSVAAAEVEMTTLDLLLAGDTPTLIKMDLEGFELPALRGASETLARAGLLGLIVELDGRGRSYGYEDEDVDGLIRQHGFSPYEYDPKRRTLTPQGSFHQFGADLSRNTLYLRSLDEVERRLRDATPFTVLGQTI